MIKRTINAIKHKLRDISLPKRSSKWEEVKNEFLQDNPNCAGCGTNKKLNVHHIIPFHIKPELELEKSNLITLCMDKKQCHFYLGHLENFKLFNPDVIQDAKNAFQNPKNYKTIIKNAIAKWRK